MRYPDFPPQRSDRWKTLYEGAISDSEHSISLNRIADARNAILDRAEEILTHPYTDERRALSHALRTLRLLEETVIREHKAA
ncbi:MAG TPA: hypothetical protein VMG82_38745 [Candidatus Sulfotelmatobacter sp.]|nr:hypothetical protein [Candidatus Sulfotelmatobacter sp.]